MHRSHILHWNLRTMFISCLCLPTSPTLFFGGDTFWDPWVYMWPWNLLSIYSKLVSSLCSSCLTGIGNHIFNLCQRQLFMGRWVVKVGDLGLLANNSVVIIITLNVEKGRAVKIRKQDGPFPHLHCSPVFRYLWFNDCENDDVLGSF